MKCPYCGYEESKVVDSRSAEEGIRRRRECLACALRFTTYERVQSVNVMVLKKDRRREGFSREKLLAGLRKACEKRPLPAGTVERLADEIEGELQRTGRAEVPSSVMGEMVMERLKKLDHIAYIRFASVYRAFADIGALKREVDTLVAGSGLASQLPLIPREELTPQEAEGQGRARQEQETKRR